MKTFISCRFIARHRGGLLAAAAVLITAFPAAAGPLAYVPITQPSGVQVIDLATNAVITTIPLNSHPSQLAITPDARFVYVTEDRTPSGEFANTVAVISTADNSVTASITVGENPEALAISPDGQFVYVANANWNSMSVIATNTNSLLTTIAVGSGPTGLVFSPDGSLLYVATLPGNSVSVINASGNTVAAIIPVNAAFGRPEGPGNVAVTPDGAFLYIADDASGDVLVLNASSRNVVGTIRTAVNPHGIAATPDGKSVYVVSGYDEGGYKVSVIDTATNVITTDIPLNASAVDGQVAISPDGAYVYVTGAGANIIVIATATNTIVDTISSGTTCGPLVFAPATAQGVSSLTVIPATISAGTSVNGTVTLTTAVPSDGAVISLSSSDPSAVVPASVTVAAGNKRASVPISAQAVASSTQVTLTAAWNGVKKTAAITVIPAGGVTVSKVTVGPDAVIAGSPATGTVTLTTAAPAGGLPIELWSGGAAAFVPSSLVVPEGAISATFPVTTVSTAATAYDTITAFYNGVSKSAILTVNPVLALTSLSVSTPLTGGFPATGTVTLNAGAPAGGITIDLWTDGTPAFVPPSLTIPSGGTTGTFAITTIYTSNTVQRTVTAFYNGGITSATLTITPVLGIASVSVTPGAVTGGSATGGRVTLTSATPGDIAVELWSSGFPTCVPARVVVPAGQISATFPVSTEQPFISVRSTITAFYNGSSNAAILEVTP